MTTTFSDGASQLLNVPPAKRFNESISQNQREESLSRIVSSIYDHSGNVIDDAIQDENRNPHVRDPGAQTLGIHKVVPCPDIPRQNRNFQLEYENFAQMSKTFRKPARARNQHFSDFNIPAGRIKFGAMTRLVHVRLFWGANI